MALATFTITNDGQFLIVTSTTGNVESINLASIKDVTCISSSPAGSMYSYPDMNLVTIEINDRESDLTFDLAAVTNQAGWTLDQAGCTQAQADIRSWLNVAASGGGGLATEATLNSVLAAIQDGQDFEAKLVVDDNGNGTTYLEVRIWNPDTQTWETPLYYTAGSNVGVAAGTLTAPIIYINPSALLSTIAGNTSDNATQTTLAAVLTELQAKADLTETQPISLPTGVNTVTQETFVAGGTVAAGAVKVSIMNIGTTNATVLGNALEPGLSIPFEATEGKTLPAIAYIASATAILKIVTTV